MNHVVLPHASSTFNVATVIPNSNNANAAAAIFDPLSGYKELLKTHPLPTKMMTGATLAVCGDAIAQSKDTDVDYDKRRAASFAVFDMAYRALQHFSFPIIVAYCHGQLLGSIPMLDALDPSQLAAMEQTLASQLGIVPFLYYPAFFSISGAIQGLTASAAWSRAQETFVPLMKRNLLFWIPVQFIQFGYIQEDLQVGLQFWLISKLLSGHWLCREMNAFLWLLELASDNATFFVLYLRNLLFKSKFPIQIPFLSCAGLAWTFILSMYAGSAKSYSPEKEMELQERSVESLKNANDGIVPRSQSIATAR